MIELKQLSKTYHTGKQAYQALAGIDLSIAPGEVFGVLGKSGAGKSTLLRCVNLLERPTSGQVIVNKVDLTTLNASQLRQQRQKIAVIFQHFNLLQSRTAYDNIALPLELLGIPKADIHKKVSSLLELVHLDDRQHHYPSELSGGQKQRVAIARALATDPQVLLCDEATSALDTHATATILNLLKEINQKLGLTILLITHELDVIKRVCDRAGVLDKGRLIEHGSTVDIFANPQADITKKLVQQSMHIDYKCIKANESGHASRIIQLTFVGKDSETPLVTTLVKEYDVSVNIQQANIEQINNTTVGYTICQITGQDEAIERALQFIRSTSIKVEVIHHE